VTGGYQSVVATDANSYGTCAYRSIFAVIDRLELQPSDVFIDIGCGKGRVICCAALSRARKIIGLDIDKALCEAAEANVRRLQGARTPIEIVNASATEFDYRDCTVFVLFNPFGAATVGKTLDAIKSTLAEQPRELRFGYVNPFHDFLFEDSGFLKCYDRWERRPWSGLKFNVSFWRTSGR
jgi:cyclopropane fatty-acyl-phospholipid synthase-like methyltransferase